MHWTGVGHKICINPPLPWDSNYPNNITLRQAKSVLTPHLRGSIFALTPTLRGRIKINGEETQINDEKPEAMVEREKEADEEEEGDEENDRGREEGGSKG